MIRMDQVVVKMGNRVILDVDGAEFKTNTVILGPNGSGKTTLLKAILGLYNIARGHVMLERNYGEEFVLPVSTNVETVYVLLDLDLKGLIKVYSDFLRCDVERMKEALSLISPKAKEFVKLSAGERKWVATMMALFADSDMVLLDEPFEDLDIRLVGKLLSLIKEFSPRRQIILTLHSLYLLKEFSDWELFFIFNGKIYGPIKTQEVFKLHVVPRVIENAVLSIDISGKRYSLTYNEYEDSIPLREIHDIAILYERAVKMGWMT